MAYSLPELPYAYGALEPHFDAQTMEIHHTKHHQAYVTNLNKLLDGSPLAGKSLEELMKETAGDAGKAGVFNNVFFLEMF